ncbi:MAG: transporter ATP-binding protein [Hyphomicrobiales bacterium]|nr:transporter ATP-binding protein [Hyphomicrobiales bacterium]
MTEPALAIADLHAFYGESHVLHGVALEVAQGEVVTIIGRNGAGKSTTMRSIMGMLERRQGSIRIRGRETIGWPSEKIARLGMGYVPEERGIYSSLDVTENLMLPPRLGPGGMSVEDIYTLFPNLSERRRSQGTRLSGGEQQMLAIGRVLRTGADIFLLDEPTEGLAPVIVQQIGVAIGAMKAKGHTMVLVEQNFRFAAKLADRHYVMEHGRIVDVIAREDVAASAGRIKAYLGV